MASNSNPFAFESIPTEPTTKVNPNPFAFGPDSLSESGANKAQGTGLIYPKTQYDKGYLTSAGDLNTFKAQQQPWYDQVTNAAIKTIPAIGLGILENAGYLGDSLFNWGNTKDYSNAFTELAIKGREKLEESAPIYRENPNEVFDLKDPAWWINHGQGLAESIGEFLVTGAGVGGTLSKAARGLQYALRTGKLGTGILQGGAQLATATSLSEVEGAMSGAKIYKDTYQSELDLHGNKEIANKKASEAASKTVLLNTVINTGLNLSSVAPLFKSLGFFEDPIRKQLSRKATESSLVDYSTRLSKITSEGIKEGGTIGVLAREALQEGLEEDVNLYAEGEGRIEGGLQKKKGTSFDRFLTSATSQEGILNFALGAIGGIGQTLGVEYAPLKSHVDEDGKQRLISSKRLEELETNEQLKNYVGSLKADIDYLTTWQQALNKAVDSKDEAGIEIAKQNLFNVANLRSIREGNGDAFVNEMQNIASLDNTELDKDGTTEAMRKGFTENPNDNSYKEIAVKRASDIKSLSKEFENLKTQYRTPEVASEVFRNRLNVYSMQNFLDNATQKTLFNEATLLPLVTDPDTYSNLLLKTSIDAHTEAINYIEESSKKATKESKEDFTKEIEELTKNKKVLEKSYEEADKNLTKINANLPLTASLYTSKVHQVLGEAKLNSAKRNYADVLSDPKKVENKVKKDQEKIVKEIKEAVKKETIKAETEQEKANLKDKVAVSKVPTRKKVGLYTIESSPDGKLHKIIDDEANEVIGEKNTYEEAEKLALKKSNINKEDTDSKPSPVDVSQVLTVNTQDKEVFVGKDITDKKEEEEGLETIIDAPIINTETNEQLKIAYKAVEQDEEGNDLSTTINDSYKILHSPKFGVGTEVTLRVATESEFYKEGDKNSEDYINNVPIGVYHNSILVGYLPINSKSLSLGKTVRQSVIDRGEIKTKVIDKDYGVLNRTDKRLASDAFPILPQFAIGKDGVLYTDIEKQYPNAIANKKFTKSGFVYAVVDTPNNKKIALPLDINKVPNEIADSVVNALAIYIAGDSLTSEQKITTKEIFEKYGLNLQTRQGLQAYVDLFLYTTDLSSPIKITQINEEVGKDRYYLQVSPNGIRYIKSGGAVLSKKGELQPKEVGLNTPNPSDFYSDIYNHIQNMYMRIDLSKVEDKSPFKAPLLKIDTKGELSYTEYSKDSYQDYIADNTTTNVSGISIGNNEVTYFVQPRIYIDYSFISKPNQKTKKIIEEKPKERVILASSKKGFSGLTTNLPVTKIDSSQVDKENAEDRNKDCT